MITAETVNAIALSMLFFNRPERLRQVYDRVGSASAIVEAADHLRDLVPDLNVSAFAIDKAELQQKIEAAKREADFIDKHQMQCLTPDSPHYPTRLREVCADAPIVLYYCGSANLNAPRVISIVGTRQSTEYGRDMVDNICAELAACFPDLLVVSGLAYGTDINAHRAALANGLPTVGVLAHGLDRIYPTVHRNTAAKMLSQGGLITEFPIGTRPEGHNFLRRNRIIAALSEATLVIESKFRGGSLYTAQLALDYGLTVMACPGRATDVNSEGCNNLINNSSAAMLTSAADVVRALGWQVKKPKLQDLPTLFDLNLSGEERMIYDCLDAEGVHTNTVIERSQLPIPRVMAVLSELEFRGVVRQLPGSKWRKLQ